MSRVVLACALLLAACAVRVGQPPARLMTLPWTDAPADQTVLRARALLDRGEVEEALALVETVRQQHPRHVDAHRVRQDILRQRGRRGVLVHELDEWLERTPDDPLALYLRGRVEFSSDRKLELFERAAQAGPERLWPWLGLAHTLAQRDPGRGAKLFESLYRSTDAHPVIAQAYAPTLARLGRERELVELWRAMAQDARVAGVGQIGLARSLLAVEDRDGAWDAVLEALRLRPFDGRVHALVEGWLAGGASDGQAEELFDLLRASPERLQAFAQNGGLEPLVELFERHRQPHAAIAVLAAAGTDARSPRLRRTERRLRLAVGDLRGFLALLRADAPRRLVLAEDNQLRGRWLTLLDGPWHAGDPLATAERAAALLTALLRTGFVAEAEQLGGLAQMRWSEDPAVAERLAEARAELAFEAALRRLLYRGYRSGSTSSLAEVTAELRAVSERIFGRDVVGEVERFYVPLVGELLDPFRGGLMAHLANYNRHLVLGRRSGGTAEGMLLSRLAVTELGEDEALPLPGRCFEVVACDRDVRAFRGVVGGDIAGVALLNHYLVDFDAVREWAGAVSERRRVVAADGGALLRDPLPAAPGFDPLDVAHRLSVMSSVEDTDLDFAVLDTIRHHERQHLVDSFYYLPIGLNLGRGLGLMLQFGLSAAVIEGEMERRAELASLAVSPHTELVLAHIVDFLGDPGAESPHHRGFSELARQLAAALRGRGVDEERALPSRWHLLDMAVVRECARELLERLP